MRLVDKEIFVQSRDKNSPPSGAEVVSNSIRYSLGNMHPGS